jgi:hypothetical protein
MALSYNKFNSFAEAIAEKVHNLGSDQLKVALTNTAPSATNTVYANLTSPVATTNLSGATPFNITTTTSSQTSGVYKLVLTDLVLTATGTVVDWRYIVLYNDTATNKELIGYYDYGATVSMSAGETTTLDFDASTGVITITLT